MIEQVNNGISHTLYQVSSALLLPVMLAVLALFFAALVMMGGFVREALERRRSSGALKKAMGIVHNGESSISSICDALSAAPSGLGRQYSRLVRDGSIARLDKSLIDLEGEVAANLGRLSFVARVGPMLGLLGTLIPFGPALAGLSSGDVQELSANLVTAFATTVVGLLCGSTAFAVASVRRGWYKKDFNDLEYIVRLLTEGHRHDIAETDLGGNGRRSDLRAGQLV